MIALTLPKMTRNIHAFQYSDFSQITFTDMESRPKSELRRQQIDLFIQVSNLERLQSIQQPWKKINLILLQLMIKSWISISTKIEILKY